ncbi:hypothetical protein DPMN_021525 [Dreissena polymorpha]|uniref:C2H2-type domain-containing protein n=1 Tax=Dreissena polymorpha TaxID=45954 RepID=A0A9D4NIQ0_DREPO|nr:hypothetical protein DPMN_021525 [Dreissena polymorpha]
MLKTRAALLRHTRKHANSGNYYCCGKAFQDAYHLRRHRASKHEGPKRHVCVQCGRSFAAKYLLAAHEKSERKQGFVKCDQCGLEVRSASDLKEHVKTHLPDKCYRCEECFKTYKHKTNLSRHVRTSHKSVNTDKNHNS